MARRGSGEGALVIFGIAIVVIAAIPKEIWISLGIIGLIVLAVYLYAKFKSGAGAKHTATNEPILAQLTSVRPAPRANVFSKPATVIPEPLVIRPSPTSSTPQIAASEESFFVAQGTPAAVSNEEVGFRIPPPSLSVTRKGTWVRPGTSITVGGVTLRDGMVYVGTSLPTSHGGNDPCLIHPHKPVANAGDFTQRQIGYWGNYSEITPSARRAYLNWLAQGRSHPDADIGYVFLFFYGLERRVLIGEKDDPSAPQDRPAITDEIHRLLGIYGAKSGSFQSYANALLDRVTLASLTTKLYERPVPELSKSFELPIYLRVALGQAAMDRAPISSGLALAWVRLNPNSALRTPAVRCADEFDRLFVERYTELFSAGMLLPRNRTKLKYVYRPASSGLRDCAETTMTFGDVPDVTVVTAPTKQLQAVVDSCIQELDNFSRVVGRNPDARNKLEGLLQLPATLWPAEMRKKLLELVGRLESGMLALRLGELLSALGGTAGPFTPDKVRGLARSLELSGIGFEPDVLNGARAPAIADSIVLFALPLSDGALTNDRAFQTAALTVQLAAGVAHADGDFSAAEVDHLRREIQSWTHLTYRCQQRLLAHLQWLTKAPIALASLKKKLESLDQLSKEGIATFMASVVQADGVVSPAEIKFLEKVYKALGVDVKRVFSDVHAATTGAPPTKSENTGFKLDTRRVNELQQDTERVSALLANIFKDDTVPIDPPIQEVAGDSEPVTQLLGLDETHAALARLMLSRPQWSREELEDAAADLQLMLDGALELINEASFDTYDLPFAEGSDPVEVNGEVLEKIAA